MRSGIRRSKNGMSVSVSVGVVATRSHIAFTAIAAAVAALTKVITASVFGAENANGA